MSSLTAHPHELRRFQVPTLKGRHPPVMDTRKALAFLVGSRKYEVGILFYGLQLKVSYLFSIDT